MAEEVRQKALESLGQTQKRHVKKNDDSGKERKSHENMETKP